MNSPLFRRASLALPLIAGVFIVAVALSSLMFRGARIDLTEAREHTLSPATIALIDGVDEPITLRLFFSERSAGDFPQVKAYAQRVRELLEELAARSKGKVRFEVIDPEPFSEDEDRATAYGLTAVPLPNGGNFFFGLVGSNSTDGELPIPFFEQQREAFLEYNLAKLIAALTQEDRPVVGLISGLPTAPFFDPAQGAPSPGWVVDQQLRELFDLRRIEKTATTLDSELDLLMLVHPQGLSDDLLYAIDQFTLNGGRVLAFVDPDAEHQPPEDVLTGEGGGPRTSDLGPLLAAWGVDFDSSKVLGDPGSALSVQAAEGAAPEPLLTLLGLSTERMNAADIVTAQMEQINVSSAGVLRARQGATTQFESLLSSSDQGGELDASVLGTVSATPMNLLRAFRAEGGARTLAARVSGPATSAFPARQGAGHREKSERDINVIVVADTDVLADAFWVNPPAAPGATPEPFANNGDFVYNAVENLSGQAGLIALRTRAVSSRPFQRVQSLRRAAEQQFLRTEQDLQQRLAELEQRLTALQRGEGGEATALSAEQQAELAQFQAEKAEIRVQLRDVQRQLNADIDRLSATLKFINIVLVPFGLALLATLMAFVRHQRRRRASLA
jgi:ABC-type uncharacterized transport system involved in gliding motility auxiliary subunit